MYEACFPILTFHGEFGNDHRSTEIKQNATFPHDVFANLPFQEGKRARRQDLEGVSLALQSSLGQTDSHRPKYTLRRGEFNAMLCGKCFYRLLKSCLLPQRLDKC